MSKPIIGITIGRVPGTLEEQIEKHALYGDAVTLAGGEPKLLPVKPDPLADIEGLDGILFTGGLDIHPRHYDPADANMTDQELWDVYRMKCEPERDEYEIPLAQAAYEREIPILGVCRGFQLLNVALGGGLVKDIRTGRKHWAIREDEKGEGKLRESRKHMITIIPESKIAQILGDCPILVNSRHHQGVTENLRSERLKATAFAPDAIIEALEGIEHPWAVAVQWHPEKTADDYIYQPCKALFEEFLSVTKRRRDAASRPTA